MDHFPPNQTNPEPEGTAPSFIFRYRCLLREPPRYQVNMGSQMPASREAARDSVISVFNGLLVPGLYLLSTFKKKHQLHFIPQKFAKFPASTETYFAVAGP